MVGALVVAALGVGAGVLIASGALRGNHRAVTSNTPIPNPPTVPLTSSTPTAAERRHDRGQIMTILTDYESAFSDHDLRGLERIFAPNVKRHGLATGGCRVSRGRDAVIADYRSQFEQGTGAYRLIGVSSNDIRIDTRVHAHVHANYEISPGGTGFVNFTFTASHTHWSIDQIYATCA